MFVTVHLPTVGEYGLEVYANEPIREGDTYTHVCQYLCAFTDRDFGAVYGQVFDRADLAHGMQASPMTYNAPGGQYATLQSGQQRGSPHMYPSATQERDGTTMPSRMYQDQMQPGDDGSAMYRQVGLLGPSEVVMVALASLLQAQKNIMFANVYFFLIS